MPGKTHLHVHISVYVCIYRTCAHENGKITKWIVVQILPFQPKKEESEWEKLYDTHRESSKIDVDYLTETTKITGGILMFYFRISRRDG